MWAPACYLTDAAKNNKLADVRKELAPLLNLTRGPEYKAKVSLINVVSLFFFPPSPSLRSRFQCRRRNIKYMRECT